MPKGVMNAPHPHLSDAISSSLTTTLGVSGISAKGEIATPLGIASARLCFSE
jgi:hypothetical protein